MMSVNKLSCLNIEKEAPLFYFIFLCKMRLFCYV